MKKIGIHQPEHLPWLGFIHKVMSVDEFVLLDNVQFRKKYFQNRNKIRTNEGEQWLMVPLKKFHSDQKINKIEISYDQDWQSKNLNRIKNEYIKAKYFGEYFQDFVKIYKTKFKLLSDLNIELIKFILQKFGICTKLYISSELLDDVGQGGTNVNLNICKKLNADIYLSGVFGKNYLDISKFEKANIKVEFQDFKHPVYKQLYDPFIPNMSSIDLLFNYGADSLSIIKGENETK
jgi:hypothetical protein